MPQLLFARRFCIPTGLAAMVSLLIILSVSCYTAQSTVKPDGAEEAYLKLEVEPTTADIYIDDQYQGVIEGWHRQTIPIEPGYRRIELRAQGYITQRFDVEVNTGKLLTLRARLEPAIDAPGQDESNHDDAPADDRPALPAPQHPTAPDTDF